MYNIVLICTRHTELGKCNTNELYHIIDEIQPEVIFEELPLLIFNQCYNENMHDMLLEQNAIKKYIKKRQIQHIPIDTLEIPNSYYENCENKLKQIFKKNGEYLILLKKISSSVGQLGFTFLNSKQHYALFEKIYILEETIINELNNKNLKDLFQLRNKTDNERENVMINNVYDYSKNSEYNKALMFTGAWHRKSFITKINEYNERNNFKIDWKLDYF